MKPFCSAREHLSRRAFLTPSGVSKWTLQRGFDYHGAPSVPYAVTGTDLGDVNAGHS